MEDRLLRAHRRQYLRLWVERRAEAPARPAGDRGAQLRQALGLRVGGERLDRRRERGADERGRLLARLADAEVDQVGAGGEQPPLRLRQPNERVRLQLGECGSGPHAANRSSTSYARTSAAISTDSSRRWACAGSPGPKLTAGRPASPNSATGVQACLGAHTSPPAAMSASTRGPDATAPDGALESIRSSPWPAHSSASRASPSDGLRPGA